MGRGQGKGGGACMYIFPIQGQEAQGGGGSVCPRGGARGVAHGGIIGGRLDVVVVVVGVVVVVVVAVSADAPTPSGGGGSVGATSPSASGSHLTPAASGSILTMGSFGAT